MPETGPEPAEQPPIFPDDDLSGTGHPHPWPFLNTTSHDHHRTKENT